MLTLRYSIARLMGIIVVLALGLTALRNPNETWAGLLIVAACGILALGVVGLVCRGKSERVWWLGLVLFGWGYLALVVFFDHHCITMTPQLDRVFTSGSVFARQAIRFE